MIKKLIKTSKLQKNDVRSIKQLVDLCAQIDGYSIKLYWNILQDRMTPEFNDFLYYADGNLVGYLALFMFKLDQIELSAVIHPKYRRQSYFRKLLQEAHDELLRRQIPRCLLIIPQAATGLAQHFTAQGAQKILSEYGMSATILPIHNNLPGVELRPATAADIPLLAEIGSISFGSPYLEVLQRFIENLKDKNRKAWLVQIGSRNIGKIHIRYETPTTVLIHDLCIIPSERGKKYALAMVSKTMQLLAKEGVKKFILDVEAGNRNALKLYEQCGFTVSSSQDFWEILPGNLL